MPATDGVIASGVPSRRRVEAITFSPMSDALRNHLATTSFVEMSNRLAMVLGSADANFCSLAVWPSFTIGATIRGGEEQRLQNLLAKVPIGAGMRKRVTARVLRGRAGKSDVLKKSLAAGNRGVFYELGLAFVDFLETFAPAVIGDSNTDASAGAATGERDAAFDAFADRIRRLPDPPGKLWPKQDRTRLIAGFRAYVDAIAETDPRRRSQLVLLGNLCIVDYEQCRLQGWLDISMVGPLRGLTKRFDDDTTENRGIALVERVWTRTLTKRVFVVEMAGETVRVGRPIPPHPSSAGALYPSPLDDLDPDVASVFDEIVGRSKGSDGAERWNDLDNRRSFIAALFRSRQRAGLVGLNPYTDAERAAIIADAAVLDAAELKYELEGPVIFAAQSVPPWPSELTPMVIDQLESARRRGDDLADRAVYDFYSTSAIAATDRHFTDVMIAVARPELDREGLVRGFLAAAPELPPWIDHDELAHAQAMYSNIRNAAHAALFFGTMPAAYAASKGVQPLGLVSDLSGNPERRLWESARFIEDIMTTPFWEQGSDGHASIRGVRLFHAAVRSMIEMGSSHIQPHREHAGDRVWEHDWGRPINQEDLLGATYDWSIGAIDVMDRLGVPMDEADARAYLHIWQVVGFMLGVEPELLVSPVDPTRPASVEEGHAIAHLILGRQIGPTVAGRRLTESLVGLMDEWFPKPLERLPRALMRVCLTDEIAAVLAIPPPAATERALLKMNDWARTWRRNDAYLRAMRRTMRWSGERWLAWWEKEYTDIPPYRVGGTKAVEARMPHRIRLTMIAMGDTSSVTGALGAVAGVDVTATATPDDGLEGALLTSVVEATAAIGSDLRSLVRGLRDSIGSVASMHRAEVEIDGKSVSLTELTDAEIDALFPAEPQASVT